MKKSRMRASRWRMPSSCSAPSVGLTSGAGGLGGGACVLVVRPSSATRSAGSLPPNRSAKNARKANKIRFKVDFAPIVEDSNRALPWLASKTTVACDVVRPGVHQAPGRITAPEGTKLGGLITAAQRSGNVRYGALQRLISLRQAPFW